MQISDVGPTKVFYRFSNGKLGGGGLQSCCARYKHRTKHVGGEKERGQAGGGRGTRGNMSGILSTGFGAAVEAARLTSLHLAEDGNASAGCG